MIPPGSTVLDSPEAWEKKEAVLHVVHPTEGVRLERVRIVSVTSEFLLCVDEKHRQQVYVVRNLLGWEPVDDVSLALLEDQNQRDVFTGRVASPSSPEEDSGIRKVLQVGSPKGGVRTRVTPRATGIVDVDQE